MTEVSRQETIVVVEDDSALRMSLRATLRAHGFRVVVAKDGEEGLELALTADADLVLLDVMMPKLNGYEVCERIRQEDPELPILMVTAKGHEDDRVRGLGLGADDYIVKPFGVAELMARVHAALRRRRLQERQSETLQVGKLRLDFVSLTAMADGEAVEFTAQEFKLIRFLHARAGRVLTRQQILDGVWGRDYFGTDRTVDNFIGRLRSKLERDPKKPQHLITVRGAGYRFER